MKKTIFILFYFSLTLLFCLEIILRFVPSLKTYTEQNFGYYINPYSSKNFNSLYTFDTAQLIRSKSKEYYYQYQINNQGFKLISSPNCPTKTKIVLGDSFTFGIGADQDSDAINRLNALQDDSSIFYLNAGIPGSDPFFEYKLMNDIFIKQGYKDFIFILNASDLYDYIFRGGLERFDNLNKLEFNNAPWYEPIYHYSYTFRAFLHGIVKADYSLLSKKQVIAKKEEAIKAYIKLFQKIQTELKAKNGSLQIFIHPYPATFQKENRRIAEVLNSSYFDELVNQLKAEGIIIYNLEKDFQEVLNQENYLDYSWEIDGHFNNNGYKILSEIINNKIVKD